MLPSENLVLNSRFPLGADTARKKYPFLSRIRTDTVSYLVILPTN